MTTRRRLQPHVTQYKENWQYQTTNLYQEPVRGAYTRGKFGDNTNETNNFRDRTKEFHSVARSIFSRQVSDP